MSAGDRTVFETPWFRVCERLLADSDSYYLLQLPDYVSVVAITVDNHMVLVRQYRPVVERHTIELPSGHVDSGETAEEAARRELAEETGYMAERLELLGTLVPDVGRLGNRMWCYFAPAVIPSTSPTEREHGIELLEMPVESALRLAIDGRMDHALNLAPLFLALALKKLPLPQ